MNNAMDKIRKLAKRNLASMTQRQIADQVGINKAAVSRFMRKKDGSEAIAKWMAERYGGECARLYSKHLVERAEKKRKQMAEARKHVVTREPREPSPSHYVPMARSVPETHHLVDLTLMGPLVRNMCGYV